MAQVAQKTLIPVDAQDLQTGSHITIKNKKYPSSSGYVFEMLKIKPKQTTSRANDWEISIKPIKAYVIKGIASKIDLPTYVYGSETSFFKVD